MEHREGYVEGTTIQTEAVEEESRAKEKAREMGARASARADAISTRVGGRMKQWGEKLRGKSSGQSGRKAQLMDRSASGLDRVGDYLEHHRPEEVGRDLTNTIRQHPVKSLAVGLGLGYLVARLVRRK